MTDESDLDKMLRPIGGPVTFQYPEGVKKGILKDRSVIQSDPTNEVPYWDVVDLIEFPEENESKVWIRIGYYRKPKDKLIWASQTTITEPVTVWKRILTQAAKEKSWFRNLLLDVAMELKE